VLNLQLSELENHGIVEKTIFPVVPPKVEYALTNKGKSLLPLIDVMRKWGNEHG
jgi:DNA-binding HxlR family transcriptional regulator